MVSHTLKIALPLALVLLFGLGACSGSGDALQRIQAQGELTVVTRNSPTTYFIDRDGPNGFEYALAGMLAQDLGVELKVDLAFTLGGLFEILRRGEADLAAAGLTLTEQRQRLFPHSAAYNRQTVQVVYVAGKKRPTRIEQGRGGAVVVLENFRHADDLRERRRVVSPGL